MGEYSFNKWNCPWFGNVCRKINENFDGFKFSKDKKWNSRYVDKLFVKGFILFNVLDDCSIFVTSMDRARLYLNSIYEDVNFTKLNHSYFYESKFRFREAFLCIWNQ